MPTTRATVLRSTSRVESSPASFAQHARGHSLSNGRVRTRRNWASTGSARARGSPLSASLHCDKLGSWSRFPQLLKRPMLAGTAFTSCSTTGPRIPSISSSGFTGRCRAAEGRGLLPALLHRWRLRRLAKRCRHRAGIALRRSRSPSSPSAALKVAAIGCARVRLNLRSQIATSRTDVTPSSAANGACALRRNGWWRARMVMVGAHAAQECGAANAQDSRHPRTLPAPLLQRRLPRAAAHSRRTR